MKLQQVADMLTQAATALQGDDQEGGIDFDYALGMVIAEELVPYLGIMDNKGFIEGIQDGAEMLSEGGYVGDEPVATHDGSFDGDDSDYNYSEPGNPKKRHTL